VLRINRRVGGFEDRGVFSFSGIIGGKSVSVETAAKSAGAAAGDDLRTGWIVNVDCYG
jgi:hypothetical protein